MIEDNVTGIRLKRRLLSSSSSSEGTVVSVLTRTDGRRIGMANTHSSKTSLNTEKRSASLDRKVSIRKSAGE